LLNNNFLKTYQQKQKYIFLFQPSDFKAIKFILNNIVDNFFILWKNRFDFMQSSFCLKNDKLTTQNKRPFAA